MSVDFDNDIISRFAETHLTDELIVIAIFRIAEHLSEVERIWQDPTPEEFWNIWEQVTNNGQFDGADFSWGHDTLEPTNQNIDNAPNYIKSIFGQ